MKKIGIMTFHWAANHGAILQAYALQTYLSKELLCDVKIINYCPKKYEKKFVNCVKIFHPKITLRNIKELKKENKLKNFRNDYLCLTKRYYSQNELINEKLDFDILICGSDQIWNPYFTSLGEGKPTYAYYLNFGKENCKRIAYSVSFGCHDYPKHIISSAKKYIERFDYIGVRESTGISILDKEGITNAIKTADPTLLIKCNDYEKLITNEHTNNERLDKEVICYILRKQNRKIKHNIRMMVKILSGSKKFKSIENTSMSEWLYSIKNAKYFITNSFHGVMMSLIFHTNFYVILEQGGRSGMNDRILTILKVAGLTHRIIDINDYQNSIEQIFDTNIDWEEVDKNLENFSCISKQFLKNALSFEK
ncbi:MAG: polysaccharide pyruvyl transferase family protein [[Clostridium] spiroforme]|uniref:Polysaccharide pyruvyl transferase family protein n=1 Tax=Thomasclavelia spiroformis TaxID=29348 RepID=A0A943ELA6_9FIRM|nr:polysaccharide pyruvyl transferase family protein [Thomasclavelia spiroformis]MBS5588777.1 polysaccharide pyruvyl transferase family protein [Thomasclavelia spiroformis]